MKSFPPKEGIFAIKADFIIETSRAIHKEKILIIKDGKIEDILNENDFQSKFPDLSYHYKANSILTASFLNSHTHIELSSLGKIPIKSSFTDWIKALVVKRSKIEEDLQYKIAIDTLKRTVKEGTIAFGDISNTGMIIDYAIRHDFFIKHFLEVLSFKEENADESYDKCLEKYEKYLKHDIVSLSPHSIYGVSESLLEKLYNPAKLQSIHIDESPSERTFLATREGEIRDFLQDIHAWDEEFKGSDLSPYEYIDRFSYLNRSILVHNLNFTNSDLKLLKRANLVLCPRSNFYLHNTLPDIKTLLDNNIKPSIGTDSLASTDDLSILNEMKFIRKKYPDIDANRIYEMGTETAAEHLEFYKLGSLKKGKSAICNYFTFEVLSGSPLDDLLDHDYKDLTVFGIKDDQFLH